MTENEKSSAEKALDQALEYLVYAPIGALFEGRTILPSLAEKGRGQVAAARIIGQFALRQGQADAARALARVQEKARDVLQALGVAAGAETERRSGEAASRLGAPPAADAQQDARPELGLGPQASAAQELAIPDYDSLAASQVVTRLAGLSPSELQAVHDYEATHRRRKTILNKVVQLQR